MKKSSLALGFVSMFLAVLTLFLSVGCGDNIGKENLVNESLFGKWYLYKWVSHEYTNGTTNISISTNTREDAWYFYEFSAADTSTGNATYNVITLMDTNSIRY